MQTFTIAYNNLTLHKGTRAECIERRSVSGDLLFDEEGKIDQYEDWLFQWELEDPTCYARQAQGKYKILK